MVEKEPESDECKLEKKSDGFQKKEIVGIHVIEYLVSSAISSPSKILSAIKQIIFFYKLLPSEWKKKAFKIFEKLWKNKQVVISTVPELPERIYGVSFDDDRLNNLYKLLPPQDQAIMLQGKAMTDLINKGLHGDSEQIKNSVEDKYGYTGVNIVNMITTGDIQYLLEEIADSTDSKYCVKKFNEWVSKYGCISALVPPFELSNPEKIKTKIKEISKKAIKDYILVNLSGKMEECTELLNLISDMKKNEELNYSNIKTDISDSGFRKSLRVKINFKEN
ncbi:MAG: hypothetical protein NTW30_03465 [Candidatus Aenigmarchaeota archaeon]|nr:hypothetical protein [Candidatus Aenigmarchaeota archaeon]